MVYNCQNGQQILKIVFFFCKKRAITVTNGPKWSEIFKLGQTWSNIIKNGQNVTDNKTNKY